MLVLGSLTFYILFHACTRAIADLKGKKAGDPTVHDLRVLQYTQEGIQFCTDFDNPLQPLPQRIKGAGPQKVKQSFTAKIPLTKRKYDDLQSLKEVIPKDCHQFYNSLPYVEKD